MPALPEIREDEAPADVARVFRRMRECAAMPQINLIYRHLATMPGMLAWTWHVLEPLYVSGALHAPTARIIAAAQAECDLPPIWAGVIDGAQDDLRQVLHWYARANAENVLALTALGTAIANGLPRRTSTPNAGAVAAAPPIVRLPRMSDLPARAQHEVRALAALHEAHEAGVVPSLYLHVALWPRAWHTAMARLATYIGSPAWRTHKAALMERVARETMPLVPQLSTAMPTPRGEILCRAATAIDLFVRGTIPDMLLVGARLTGGSPR